MIVNKSTATILAGLVVVVAIVVIEYVRRDADGSRNASSGMAPSHPAAEAASPSKENASKALKADIEHLRRVLESDSTNSTVAFEVARLLQDSHNSRDAARYYALGLKSDPKNDSARVDYSLCLYELGRRTEALQECKRVLKSDPVSPEALFNLGAIFANDGIRDSAVSYWGKLIAKHPGHELALRAKENLRTLEGKSTSL